MWNKNTMKEPSLLCDDHHGIYMMHLLWKELDERYKKQARKHLSDEDIKAIEAGPDDEWHFEACDALTELSFTTPTGQKFEIQYAEGGIWAIPHCFRGKKRDDFFGA